MDNKDNENQGNHRSRQDTPDKIIKLSIGAVVNEMSRRNNRSGNRQSSGSAQYSINGNNNGSHESVFSRHMLNLRTARVQIYEQGRFNPFSNTCLTRFLPTDHRMTRNQVDSLTSRLRVDLGEEQALLTYQEQESLERHFQERCNDYSLGVYKGAHGTPFHEQGHDQLDGRPVGGEESVADIGNRGKARIDGQQSTGENSRVPTFQDSSENSIVRRVNVCDQFGVSSGEDFISENISSEVADKACSSKKRNLMDINSKQRTKTTGIKIKKINSEDGNVPYIDHLNASMTTVSNDKPNDPNGENIANRESSTTPYLGNGQEGIVDDIKVGESWENYKSCSDQPSSSCEQPMQTQPYRDPDVAVKIQALEESSDYIKEILRWKFLNNCVDMTNYRIKKQAEEKADKNNPNKMDI